jgi:hypothetical protein
VQNALASDREATISYADLKAATHLRSTSVNERDDTDGARTLADSDF